MHTSKNILLHLKNVCSAIKTKMNCLTTLWLKMRPGYLIQMLRQSSQWSGSIRHPQGQRSLRKAKKFFLFWDNRRYWLLSFLIVEITTNAYEYCETQENVIQARPIWNKGHRMFPLEFDFLSDSILPVTALNVFKQFKRYSNSAGKSLIADPITPNLHQVLIVCLCSLNSGLHNRGLKMMENGIIGWFINHRWEFFD